MKIVYFYSMKHEPECDPGRRARAPPPIGVNVGCLSMWVARSPIDSGRDKDLVEVQQGWERAMDKAFDLKGWPFRVTLRIAPARPQWGSPLLGRFVPINPVRPPCSFPARPE